MNNFKELFGQLSTIFLNLTKRQKIVAISSVVAVVALIVFLLLFTRAPKGSGEEFSGYSVLFANVEPSVSAQIIAQLEMDGVKYKLADENTILVPNKDVYRERIAVASLGIVQASKTKPGFELFDTNSFGATEGEQRIKFQRAIQGELSKTIESLEPIERASVYIAFPKESVFTERQTPPTASVVVKLKNGSLLDYGQIDGIKRIVSGSIPNLSLENVKIVTQDGVAVGEDSVAMQNEQEAARIKAQLRYKHEFESNYEAKIIDMIARFVGSRDKVTAKVSIEFDFSQTDKEQEIFDPNSVVRSEQNIEEHKVGRDPKELGGVPGAVSNIGPVQGIEDNKPTQEYDKTVTNTNYEISKQIIKTKPQFATIKRLTAAVVVDGRYENVRDESGELTSKINYIPLNENEVNQIRSLVEQAVGYNQARGDQVTVSNFEFRPNNISTPLTKFQRFEEEYIKPLLPVLKYLLVALILFVFYKKVIVPFMNKMLMDTKPQEEAVFEEEIDVEEEAEDTIERFKAAKKRAEDELGMNDDFNEEDLKYDVLLEKMKGIVAERSDEVASLLQSMVKTDNSFSGSKDF
ncbi:flagellar inner membrane MS-ring protein FliF [Candidatus Campylobacter infans]|uniref:Flagellar M-ring protein n=1 Tax=Candidatus Campylobacter infans TaxID=2561898 RepID=A0A7H9CIG9_9BACT|nr:flagellar basal-body MS-ring/collar protein FliF [Candidatus Campylobacter infans]KAF0590828.1 MAG: flagellar inner membrane MS-ring protein FliF [Candidatus Campylobacter infans]QLI05890.1 flagellar inner membrane MS-ring protein FliF [Candidatus Campylobacter infans]